jgi:very-short-patch-repair endonuclease
MYCGKDNYFFGKKHTEESKKKMSESKKGRIGWSRGLTKDTDIRIKNQSDGNIGNHRGFSSWIEKDYNKFIEHQREAGIKGTEAQSVIGFTSKPELIMKELLPIDFIHNKYFEGGIPDFRSPELKIIIEVDGKYWHSFPERIERDNKHTKHWQEMGYTVFRIPEKDVNEYMGCLL